ncbi:hypothetical protein A3Q56_02378 [Intoshia linei]|uniref:Uncharacterized protein n=1 Tax=Intoshia linei TaxID=1819745 RepID=A0A177B8X3_9BILA|nr:hypothetical protein A3Q56_02378 [Intoshia linei]
MEINNDFKSINKCSKMPRMIDPIYFNFETLDGSENENAKFYTFDKPKYDPDDNSNMYQDGYDPDFMRNATKSFLPSKSTPNIFKKF